METASHSSRGNEWRQTGWNKTRNGLELGLRFGLGLGLEGMQSGRLTIGSVRVKDRASGVEQFRTIGGEEADVDVRVHFDEDDLCTDRHVHHSAWAIRVRQQQGWNNPFFFFFSFSLCNSPLSSLIFCMVPLLMWWMAEALLAPANGFCRQRGAFRICGAIWLTENRFHICERSWTDGRLTVHSADASRQGRFGRLHCGSSPIDHVVPEFNCIIARQSFFLQMTHLAGLRCRTFGIGVGRAGGSPLGIAGLALAFITQLETPFSVEDWRNWLRATFPRVLLPVLLLLLPLKSLLPMVSESYRSGPSESFFCSRSNHSSASFFSSSLSPSSRSIIRDSCRNGICK